MSDEEQEEKPHFLDQFNGPLEAAFHWLSERGYDNAECPICHTRDWVIETRPDPKTSEIDYSAPVFAMKDPRSFWGAAPAIVTLAFTCTECGFLRQHNVPWIEGKISAEEDDG